MYSHQKPYYTLSAAQYAATTDYPSSPYRLIHFLHLYTPFLLYIPQKLYAVRYAATTQPIRTTNPHRLIHFLHLYTFPQSFL